LLAISNNNNNNIAIIVQLVPPNTQLGIAISNEQKQQIATKNRNTKEVKATWVMWGMGPLNLRGAPHILMHITCHLISSRLIIKGSLPQIPIHHHHPSLFYVKSFSLPLSLSLSLSLSEK
jgi:hypothetical protein